VSKALPEKLFIFRHQINTFIYRTTVSKNLSSFNANFNRHSMPEFPSDSSIKNSVYQQHADNSLQSFNDASTATQTKKSTQKNVHKRAIKAINRSTALLRLICSVFCFFLTNDK